MTKNPGVSMKPPKWAEEEIILVLNLYFEIKRGEKKHSRTVLCEMSEKLRRLNVYPGAADNITFRNANGISRKLGNFSAVDPDYKGEGLRACSNLDRIVFMKFCKDPDGLKEAVTAIERRFLGLPGRRKRQLAWTEDEMILTLALYNTLTYGKMHGTNPKVVMLSELLRSLPIYGEDERPENFRSAASVSLRLSNFRSCDPRCNAKGLLSSGTGLFKEIFNNFYGHPELLAHAVSAVERKYNISIGPILCPDVAADKETKEPLTEISPSTLYQFHKEKESESPFLQKVKQYHGGKSSVCEACGSDICQIYGKLGRDIMEYHCVKNFSAGNFSSEKVCIGDYIQVCPTCHKLLDKHYGLIDWHDLKKVIKRK